MGFLPRPAGDLREVGHGALLRTSHSKFVHWGWVEGGALTRRAELLSLWKLKSQKRR